MGDMFLSARSICRAIEAVATSVILTGCMSTPRHHSPIKSSWQSEEVPAERLSSRSVLSREGGGAVTSDPTGDLTLDQAAALSLERNPKLSAYSWEWRRAEARTLQAGLWPNPEIEAEIENIGGSGDLSGTRAAETTVGFSQTLPLGGDIGRRRELARLKTQLADWDYEAARLDALLDVTQRFFEALAADRRVELAKQELELAKATQRVTRGRVEAGDLSPVELARVVVPIVTAEVGLERAERLRTAAYRRLSLTWGAQDVTFDRVVGDLDTTFPPPDAKMLVQAINDNPSVARWATEISARIAERRLAKAEAIPDVTGRLGVKQENLTDDTALVVGVSLPVPLFDRRQGDVLAARLGESAARQQRRAAELRIETMLTAAYANLVTAQTEAVALRNRALPAAERAFGATQRAFREGELPFLDVLDAQRTFFGLQRRYLEALVVYHTETAELESLIGQRLSAFMNQSPPRQGNEP